MKAILIREAWWISVVSCILLLLTTAASAQVTVTNFMPVITIEATIPLATWSGSPGVFTFFRSGNLTPPVNVYYCIDGTASNGVDYQSIGHLVDIPAGATSTNVVIEPIDLGQTNIATVTLNLCPSPLTTPVNYEIGFPHTATVYIAPDGVTNPPPTVTIVSPTNGSVFHAPGTIELISKASSPLGTVTNVEYFAGTNDLGRGLPVVLDPPGVYGVVGPVYFLSWNDVPAGSYPITAVATDDVGDSSTSSVVNITVTMPSPPTNHPPTVRITNPANGSVFLAPVNIPLFAFASDFYNGVASVQFFAGGNSLGFAHRTIVAPTPLPLGGPKLPNPIPVLVGNWELIWTNPPVATNLALNAIATGNGGLSSTSAPVTISILPSPPPPTNRPPIVTIVATDPIAIEGTNCWPWIGLANATPTWSNWFRPYPPFRFFTNCGPKNATFAVQRYGATNNDLDVAYDLGGTASNGLDYATLPGSVTIPAGERSALITVMPIDDGPPDVNTTVIVKLAKSTNAPPAYIVGFPRAAAALIVDGNGPPPFTGLLPGSYFHLAIPGPDAAWFRIEYSTNLSQWTPVCTNQVISGSIDFVDPDAAGNPGRFYRAVPLGGP